MLAAPVMPRQSPDSGRRFMADRRPRSRRGILRTAGAAMAIPPVGSAAVTADEDDLASVSLGSAQDDIGGLGHLVPDRAVRERGAALSSPKAEATAAISSPRPGSIAPSWLAPFRFSSHSHDGPSLPGECDDPGRRAPTGNELPAIQNHPAQAPRPGIQRRALSRKIFRKIPPGRARPCVGRPA
jgi:hypothetical protein